MVTRKEANRRAHRESPGALAANTRYHREVVEPRRKATRLYIKEHPKCIRTLTMSSQQLISAIALKLPSRGFAVGFEQLYHLSRRRLIEEYREYYDKG